MTLIDSIYFKKYREKLGFSNQKNVINFFAAKDIIPIVDFKYIELFNARLIEIILKMNDLSHSSIKIKNLDSFCEETVKLVFKKLKDNNIISKLNNQGRSLNKFIFLG